MNKAILILLSFYLITSTFAQDLKPKKDKATKKYGYVNPSDEWVVKADYDDADKIKDGFGVVYKDKKQGLINEKGQLVVEPQFDDIEKFKNDVAIFKLNKKYGFIDKEGKIISEAVYDEILPFEDGLASAEKDKKFGLIDKSGKLVFDILYNSKFAFNNKGLAYVTLAGIENSAGLAKKDGTFAFNCEFRSIYQQDDRYFNTKPDAKFVIYDLNFQPISPEFDEIRSVFTVIFKERYINDGMILARQGSKWGFVDEKGNVLIPYQFDEVGSDDRWTFSYGYCPVRVGADWGYIDKTGKYFVEPKFHDAKRFREINGKKKAEVSINGTIWYLHENGKVLDLNGLPYKGNYARNQYGTSTATNASSSGSQTTSSSLSRASSGSITNQKSTSQSSSTSAIDNAWLIGKWKVTEEKMANKTNIGNKTKYVSWEFKAGGAGNMVERYDIMANQTQTKSARWSLNGNSLEISNVKYTIIPSANKKTMTMTGPLGTSWKLSKM
jgi:hypothetical protein